MDLLAMASRLYQSGYSVLASREKIPAHRWRWADEQRDRQIGRDGLYTMAQHAIMSGRADSLSVRMDADTAALDLDFQSEELTACFVHLFDRHIDRPHTVRGRKGCKIFCRIENKDGVERTVAVGRTLYPPARPGCLNSLEVKLDISAVYGRHSEGVCYRPYGSHAAVWETEPGSLPLVAMWQVERLLERAAEEMGYSESPRVTEEELRKAAACLSLARVHGYGTARGFASEFGTDFMCVVLDASSGRDVEGPLAQAARDFVRFWQGNADTAGNGYELFAREMDAMLVLLAERGLLDAEDASQTDPLAIYEKYAML